MAAAVCLLILTLLPAGAFAESVTFDYGMDKSYNNGRLLWDGDKLLLDVYPETSCQGLFNQIHRKATKKCQEALSCS